MAATKKRDSQDQLNQSVHAFRGTPIALIHTTSRGLPRAVNNTRGSAAIQALIAAYADRKAIVDESAARVAAAEVTAD